MRVAVVTGATGSLGGAVARAFGGQGYEVHRIDSHEPHPETESSRLHVVDLLDLDAARQLAREFGAVDALALCAGGFSMAALGAMNHDDIDGMIDINYKTAAHALAAFTPKLGHGSAVVLVGSQSYEGTARMAPYAASKAAVVSLAKSAAAELKTAGVQVNVVLPDTMDTQANRRSMPDADFSRWAKVEEVAAVIAWLCSPAAKVVSGNAIRVGR